MISVLFVDLAAAFGFLLVSLFVDYIFNLNILELIVRFLSSPSKIVFLKSFLNILDFLAVLPFFVNLVW